jgi:hypothetical protein
LAFADRRWSGSAQRIGEPDQAKIFEIEIVLRFGELRGYMGTPCDT